MSQVVKQVVHNLGTFKCYLVQLCIPRKYHVILDRCLPHLIEIPPVMKLPQCPNKILKCLSLHTVRTYFLIFKKYSYVNIFLTFSIPIALIIRTVGITGNCFYLFRRRTTCCRWWDILIRATFYSIQAFHYSCSI